MRQLISSGQQVPLEDMLLGRRGHDNGDLAQIDQEMLMAAMRESDEGATEDELLETAQAQSEFLTAFCGHR